MEPNEPRDKDLDALKVDREQKVAGGFGMSVDAGINGVPIWVEHKTPEEAKPHDSIQIWVERNEQD